MPFKPVHIRFSEPSGIDRKQEPVSIGIPFARGQLSDVKKLALTDDSNAVYPFDSRVLARWPDGSVRWLLVDTQVSLPPEGQKILCLSPGTKRREKIDLVEISKSPGQITVDTGHTVFCLETLPGRPLLKSIRISGASVLEFGSACLSLTDMTGKVWLPVVDDVVVEHDTGLKKTLSFKGFFAASKKRHAMAFEIRAYFYAGLSRVRLDMTVKNPKPAFHRKGAWDLGDPNAIVFKDLSFSVIPKKREPLQGCYVTEKGQAAQKRRGSITVFQASSGGGHWNCTTHVNAGNQVPLAFSGFKVFEDGKMLAHGGRAEPLGAVFTDPFWLSVYCEHFWQNFPTALDLDALGFHIRLFPRYHGDAFELQPGEQKTHTIHLALGQKPLAPLEGCTAPLVPVLSCRDLAERLTNPRPSAASHQRYEHLIGQVIEGPHSFSAKNETVDEFGWRNFGDVWADHESAYSETPLVSHYNNQYDLIKGLVIQFMRTGDARWFHLARNMGSHVEDIDIYHTDEDKPQYNRGMFWHTDHHLDAATSTHRTVSSFHQPLKPAGCFGGGPAPDHNYATGLLYLYWLTGETRYKKSVLELAANIIDCFNAPNSFSEMAFNLVKAGIKRIRTGKNKPNPQGEVLRFNGPSRVSGNSLNTLIDAYLLTCERRYLSHAEQVIQTCVSPEDNFEHLALHETETRWMYTVFLLALGRYLDVKYQFGQTDALFLYSQAVLLRYAAWMAENERPYLDQPEKLEYPTETWAAQDLRKADIFAYAACHAQGLQRQLFIEKSRFFLDDSLLQLSSFESCHFTRAVAILMTNGMPSIELSAGRLPKDMSAIPCPKNRPGPSMRRGKSNFLRNLSGFSLGKEIRWIRVFINSKS